MMSIVWVLLAVAGAGLVAAGVAMVCIPAALVVGGAELVATAYVGQYLAAKGGVRP